MKIGEKEEAIRLRKSGASYSEILKQISASKSSLSYWLRAIELTEGQKLRIHGKDLQARQKFVEYNKVRQNNARAERNGIISKACKEISFIGQDELKLIGIALYWAEGYKTESARGVEFANSDPAMIQLMLRWFREICMVPESKVRLRIQLHDQSRTDRAIDFWSGKTGVPRQQFTKPYVKTSPTSQRKAGNVLEHGVCQIRISDSKLLSRIKGWIQGFQGPIV